MSSPLPSPFQKYLMGLSIDADASIEDLVVIGPIEDSLEGMRPLRWSSAWGDGVLVGSLPESTQRRLNYMVDPEMYRNEPLYHGMVSQFRMWLVGAEMAMRDEEVDNEVIECVLNRMVYGHPSGAEAHERIDMRKQMQEMAERMPVDTTKVMEALRDDRTPPVGNPAAGVHDAWNGR